MAWRFAVPRGTQCKSPTTSHHHLLSLESNPDATLVSDKRSASGVSFHYHPIMDPDEAGFRIPRLSLPITFGPTLASVWQAITFQAGVLRDYFRYKPTILPAPKLYTYST